MAKPKQRIANAISNFAGLTRSSLSSLFLNFSNPSRYRPRSNERIIHNTINVLRDKIPQPYAISATERNFKANANSIKPKTTFSLSIQSPDFGADFSQFGNIANSENGNAKATAKPSIPIIGISIPSPETASTKRNPIIGPVQEKETRQSVNAIKNIEANPAPLRDLLLIIVLHDDGNVISNSPKNDSANTTKSTKKIRFGMAWVANALSALAPNNNVMSSPNPT